MMKNQHVSDVLNRAKETFGDEEKWDDDFASDITLSKVPRELLRVSQASRSSADDSLKTANKSSLGMKSLI